MTGWHLNGLQMWRGGPWAADPARPPGVLDARPSAVNVGPASTRFGAQRLRQLILPDTHDLPNADTLAVVVLSRTGEQMVWVWSAVGIAVAAVLGLAAFFDRRARRRGHPVRGGGGAFRHVLPNP